MMVEIIFTATPSNMLQSCLLPCTVLLELIHVSLAFVAFLWTYCDFPSNALMSLSPIPINIFHMLKKSISSFPLKTVLLGAFHPSTPIQMCCFIFESHLQLLSDEFLFCFVFPPVTSFLGLLECAFQQPSKK